MTTTMNETQDMAQGAPENFAAMMTGEPGEKIDTGAASRLAMLDPGTLTVGANARTSVHLGRDFVASIKTHGVLQPIVAVRDPDGAVVVRLGQRRTLAAVRAGLDSVPVWVIEGAADEAERIVAQMVENDHRDAMEDTDRVAAVEQLSLLGMTAASIAKQLHRPRAEVKAALSVAKSATARAALAANQDAAHPGDVDAQPAPLTLVQAALLAEVDDDAADVERLRAEFAAGRSGEHVAQQIRDRRARAKAKAAAERAARADGLAVVPEGEGVDLADLVDADGQPLTPAGHATCPGHAVHVWHAYVRVNPTTGEPLPDDEAEHDDADTDEGAEAWAWRWTRGAVCLDLAAHGHYWDGEAPAQQAHPDDETDEENSRRTATTPATREPDPEQIGAREEAARLRAEADQKARAAREAWDAARTVRRAWVAGHIAAARKAPAGAARLIAREAVTNRYVFGHQTVALELLGLDAVASAEELADRASDQRAEVIALVYALAKDEAGFPLVPPTGDRIPDRHREYLNTLTRWGYETAPIEADALAASEPLVDQANEGDPTTPTDTPTATDDDEKPTPDEGNDDEPDPLTRPCEGCNADTGEPCRPGCLNHSRTADDEADDMDAADDAPDEQPAR